jgi:hypothetical protein
MGKTLCRFVVITCAVVGLIGSDTSVVRAKKQAPQGAQGLLSIGKAGPNAIDLKIRTDKPEGQPLEAGDSVVLHVRASRECYITAIYVSAKGDAVVLFPNSKTPGNLIKPEQEYTLFGESSGIKLKVSDTMKEGRIVFFASAAPLSLVPLKAAQGQACISIEHTAAEEIGTLKQKIEVLAKDEGFNRIVLQLKARGTKGGSLNLMGLPSSVGSDKPEDITGVQGVKDQDAKP